MAEDQGTVRRRPPILTVTHAALLIAFACIIALGLFVRSGVQERGRICDVVGELVAEAIGDADGDGEPDRPPADLTAVLNTSTFDALDGPNQAMWTLVLTGLSNREGPTTNERISRFARGCG